MIQLGKFLSTVKDKLAPRLEDVFKAYQYVQPSQLKVLILGQDPYPTPGVAHGLAFSYRGKSAPRSLKIIFDELEQEGLGKRTNPDLTDWASQGVMLLNTILTTEQGSTMAHHGRGWERFISRTLQHISTLTQPYVIMAWGTPAKDIVRQYIDVDAPNRLILSACHPMAQVYSGGKIKFVGCDHFNKCNQFLTGNGIALVNWV